MTRHTHTRTQALEDFLRKCFVRNPKERATASELCQHEWIREHLAAHLDTGAASGADSRHHSYEQLTSSITKANLHESKISCSQAPRQGSEQLLLGANAVIPLSLHTKLSETLSKRQEIRAQCVHHSLPPPPPPPPPSFLLGSQESREIDVSIVVAAQDCCDSQRR